MKDAEFTHKELERRIFHLKTLYDASQNIASLKNSSEILKNLLMMIIGTFGAISGFAVLVDNASRRIAASSQRGMSRTLTGKLQDALSQGHFNELKELTGTLVLTDMESLQKNGKKKIMELLFSHKISVWVPMIVDDDLFGGIGLGDKLTGDTYSSDDMELLSTLSNQGAICVENARLVEQLERRIYHLKTLYDVSQDINFLTSTQEIMKSLLMMIMGTFGVMGGFIVLVNTEEYKVEAVSQRGLGKKFVEKLNPIFSAEASGKLRNLNEVTVLDKKDSGKTDVHELLSSSGISIWIPFEVNEMLKGGIGLGGKLSGDVYSQDDQYLLSTLANQGSVAVENSKLVQQMKKEEMVRTNLSRYLSPQIVDRVIKNDVQLNLGGSRKEVTILFSDIRDFTTISETMPPDQLVHILNEYFTAMADIIFESQGSLDKYIGDAVVAVFGSLINLDNPGYHAVQAAIQMMKKMTVLNMHWMDKYDFSMDIGIGINTGEVFLGNIGSPERMEFTVIGDTVNVASRFSGLARPGQILMTKESLSRIGESNINYRELTPSKVKGKSGKLEVFEVVFA